MENLPAKTDQKEIVRAGFDTSASFDLIQRQAKMLAASDLVPKEFKGNIANCIIGLEMANRMGASPLAVFQNLYIVYGKPSWSAQFVTAAINSTGNFSPLRFRVEGEGDGKSCTAWAIEKATGEKLEGPPASIQMAKDEGWYGKNGSKWKTMPDLMLRYRAATFFGRLYAPEILMGMQTSDEIIDVYDVNSEVQSATENKKNDLKERLKAAQEDDAKVECPNSGDKIKVSFCNTICDQREGCPAH